MVMATAMVTTMDAVVADTAAMAARADTIMGVEVRVVSTEVEDQADTTEAEVQADTMEAEAQADSMEAEAQVDFMEAEAQVVSKEVQVLMNFHRTAFINYGFTDR